MAVELTSWDMANIMENMAPMIKRGRAMRMRGGFHQKKT